MFYVLCLFYTDFPKRRKRTATSSSSSNYVSTTGPSTIINVQYSDVDPDPSVDIESSEESDYDYIHAGYDIYDPDIVRAYFSYLMIFTMSVYLQPLVDSNTNQSKQTTGRGGRGDN